MRDLALSKIVVPLPQELVVGTVAFAVLCFVMMRFVFPRMEHTIAARLDATKGGIARAEQIRSEADALLEQYRQELAAARGNAAQVREEAHAEAAQIRDELVARAREEAAAIVDAGRVELAAERIAVVATLREQVAEIAVELATRIIGEPVPTDAMSTGHPPTA